MNQADNPMTSYNLLQQLTAVVLLFQAVFLLAQIFNDGQSGGMTAILAATLTQLFVVRRLTNDPQRRLTTFYIILWKYSALAVLGVLTVIIAVDTYAPDTQLDGVPALIAMLLPAVIALKGAVLGKLKPGGVLGLRLRWTRQSRLAWEIAHRLMGRILFFGGLLLLVAAPFVPFAATFMALAALVVTSMVAGTIKSWRVWRIDPERGAA